MKTIVETSSKLSKFLLADDVEVVSTTTEITVGNPQASNPASYYWLSFKCGYNSLYKRN